MRRLFPPNSDRASKDLLAKDVKRFAAVTRGAKGCIVAEGVQRISVPATKVETVVDSTGAGDLFASGFLRGYTMGRDHETSAKLGVAAAGHIIAKIGPRPLQPLKDLPEIKAALGE